MIGTIYIGEYIVSTRRGGDYERLKQLAIKGTSALIRYKVVRPIKPGRVLHHFIANLMSTLVAQTSTSN